MDTRYGWRPTAGRSTTLTGSPAVRSPDVPPPLDDAERDATLAAVVDGFLAAARDGTARNRSHRPYQPSALRDIAGCLRNHVLPELGAMRLRDVQCEDLQRLVDDLAAGDLSLSRVRSVVSAIRALFAYAVARGIVEASPADRLEIARLEMPAADVADDGDWADLALPVQPLADDAWAHEPAPGPAMTFALRGAVAVFLVVALTALAQALLSPA